MCDLKISRSNLSRRAITLRFSCPSRCNPQKGPMAPLFTCAKRISATNSTLQFQPQSLPGAFQGRAQGDGPKVTEPNLQFPAVFCENLRFSAKILRPPIAWISRRRGESAKICSFLQTSAFKIWAFSVTLGPSPWACPLFSGVDAPSGSWRGSILVSFRLVLGCCYHFNSFLTETDRNLINNRPKADPLQGVRSGCAIRKSPESCNCNRLNNFEHSNFMRAVSLQRMQLFCLQLEASWLVELFYLQLTILALYSQLELFCFQF